MSEILEKKKVKLEEEKKKILLKEKLINEQERKKRAKKFIDIGRLAHKASIDQIDNNLLLGAFLEIAENIKNDNLKEQWLDKATLFEKKSNQDKGVPLLIKLKEKISNEISLELKKLNFKWNTITQSYLGRADKDMIEQLLKNIDAKVIEISY